MDLIRTGADAAALGKKKHPLGEEVQRVPLESVSLGGG